MSAATLALRASIGILVIGAALYALRSGTSLNLSSCSDKLSGESKSGDGRYLAASFERNCGATVDFSTIVVLRPANEPFDSDIDPAVVFKGQCKVGFEWGAATLAISYPAACEPFHQMGNWKDLRISLQPQ